MIGRRSFGWIAAAVILFSLVFWRLHLHSADAKKTVDPPALFDSKRFRLDYVKRRDLKRWGVVPGVVHAFRKVEIFSHVPGYLKFLNVDKGDIVHKGLEVDIGEDRTPSPYFLQHVPIERSTKKHFP